MKATYVAQDDPPEVFFANFIIQSDQPTTPSAQQTVNLERFVSFVWIVCIAILFVTGTFFFGWSIYSEMRLANVKEDTTSS
jgi:hypothetical protein